MKTDPGFSQFPSIKKEWVNVIYFLLFNLDVWVSLALHQFQACGA